MVPAIWRVTGIDITANIVCECFKLVFVNIFFIFKIFKNSPPSSIHLFFQPIQLNKKAQVTQLQLEN